MCFKFSNCSATANCASLPIIPHVDPTISLREVKGLIKHIKPISLTDDKYTAGPVPIDLPKTIMFPISKISILFYEAEP